MSPPGNYYHSKFSEHPLPRAFNVYIVSVILVFLIVLLQLPSHSSFSLSRLSYSPDGEPDTQQVYLYVPADVPLLLVMFQALP